MLPTTLHRREATVASSGAESRAEELHGPCDDRNDELSININKQNNTMERKDEPIRDQSYQIKSLRQEIREVKRDADALYQQITILK
jgi:hypothetical protein